MKLYEFILSKSYDRQLKWPTFIIGVMALWLPWQQAAYKTLYIETFDTLMTSSYKNIFVVI